MIAKDLKTIWGSQHFKEKPKFSKQVDLPTSRGSSFSLNFALTVRRDLSFKCFGKIGCLNLGIKKCLFLWLAFQTSEVSPKNIIFLGIGSYDIFNSLKSNVYLERN